jgi:hypothetical protein
MRCWEKKSNVTRDDIHAHEVLLPNLVQIF